VRSWRTVLSAPPAFRYPRRQEPLLRANDSEPEGRQMRFRIGVNVDLDGTVNRVEHAHEFSEHAIPAVFSIRLRCRPMSWSTTVRRADSIALVASSAVHQAPVPLDIGGEDPHKSSLDRRSLHPRKAPILREAAVSGARLRPRAGR
jgi:hypothetical protein